MNDEFVLALDYVTLKVGVTQGVCIRLILLDVTISQPGDATGQPGDGRCHH